MQAFADDDIVQNGPCSVAPLPKRRRGRRGVFRSDDRRQANSVTGAARALRRRHGAGRRGGLKNSSPNLTLVKGPRNYELRAIYLPTAVLLLYVRLSSLEGADPATSAAALHLARWFRARLSGQSVDGAKTPEKTPTTPRRRTTWIYVERRRPCPWRARTVAETMIGARRRATDGWRARRRAGRRPCLTWLSKRLKRQWRRTSPVIND